jgi:hypothetical protein
MVRPERMHLSRARPEADNIVRGRIASLVFLGGFHAARVTLTSGKTVLARLSPAEFTSAGAPAPGDDIHLSWPVTAARVLLR